MKRTLGLLTVIALARTSALAQGCSDAGVCSAGPIGQLSLWQDSTTDVVHYRHYVRVLYSYAIGEQGVSIMNVQPEMNVGISDRLSLQAKVPYVTANGNLGQKSGIGDLILSTSYAVYKTHENEFTLTTGLRVPTGKAGPSSINKATFGPSAENLPMPYQTGLGTLDLLLGAQYRLGRWTWALAYQHVLKQDSYSAFMHSTWKDEPDALGYFESFALRRADDVVARLQYAYGCGRLALQPGLLGIYHVGTDSRMVYPGASVWSNDTTPFRYQIEESRGLTLNLTADLRYKLSEQWAVEAMFGAPVVTREVRPDGLTRSFVTGFGLRYRF